MFGIQECVSLLLPEISLWSFFRETLRGTERIFFPVRNGLEKEGRNMHGGVYKTSGSDYSPTPEDPHDRHQRIGDGTRLVRCPSFHHHLADGSPRGLHGVHGRHPHHRRRRFAPERGACERACDASLGRLLQEGGAIRGGTRVPRW